MTKLLNIHPGEVLLEEFLIPLGISQYKLARDLQIPQTRVSKIVNRKKRISADTALRMSRYFGTSAKYWLSLQADFDLEEAQHGLEQTLATIPEIGKSKS